MNAAPVVPLVLASVVALLVVASVGVVHQAAGIAASGQIGLELRFP